MFSAMFYARYILAFTLSAPFFMAALNSVPEFVGEVDDFLARHGHSSHEFRGLIGNAANHTIDDLVSRSNERYVPSDLARKVDAVFPGLTLESRVSHFDEAITASYTARNDLSSLIRN